MADGVIFRVTDGVAGIRFNRPDRLNAINVEAARAFRDAALSVSRDSGSRAVVLSGEGRAFIAGGDLAYLKKASRRDYLHLGFVKYGASGKNCPKLFFKPT